MSERENTSLPEKAKTLKEKVDAAKRYLAGFPDHESDTIYQALTALEERVKELEKEHATHEISAVYVPSKQELELTWRDLQTGKGEGLTVVVPPLKGEAIADLVWPCTYWKATSKEAPDNGGK